MVLMPGVLPRKGLLRVIYFGWRVMAAGAPPIWGIFSLFVGIGLVSTAAYLGGLPWPWVAVCVVGVLLLIALTGGYRLWSSAADALAELAEEKEGASAPAPLIGGTWTGNTFSHFGQFVGTPTPDGSFPMTPYLMESSRRQFVLDTLIKLYAASHEGRRPPPKEWAEARLEELGENWRLNVYDFPLSRQELMADQEG